MKERPILFNAPMVRAILDGSKTQTRRIIKPDYLQNGNYEFCHVLSGTETNILSCKQPATHAYAGFKHHLHMSSPAYYKCPYGQVYDQLWVRETWLQPAFEPIIYKADKWAEKLVNDCKKNPSMPQLKWRPSIFMPRAVSRIQLEITNIRVERLNDISYADAMAEGWNPKDSDGRNPNRYDPKTWYRHLWEEINGAGSWETNHWVWVIEFRGIKP